MAAGFEPRSAPFVMVTGWNEWTAGKLASPAGPVVFVDQFDQEFSRDIEPVNGLHATIIITVGRERCAASKERHRPFPSASPPQNHQSVPGGFEQWRDVGPELYWITRSTTTIVTSAATRLHYTNQTGRNDLIAHESRARRDEFVYFYAPTRQPLSPPARTRTGCGCSLTRTIILEDGMGGYDYIVNRNVGADGTTWLEQNQGGNGSESRR